MGAILVYKPTYNWGAHPVAVHGRVTRRAKYPPGRRSGRRARSPGGARRASAAGSGCAWAKYTYNSNNSNINNNK